MQLWPASCVAKQYSPALLTALILSTHALSLVMYTLHLSLIVLRSQKRTMLQSDWDATIVAVGTGQWYQRPLSTSG